jgi:hypothetical protein
MCMDMAKWEEEERVRGVVESVCCTQGANNQEVRNRESGGEGGGAREGTDIRLAKARQDDVFAGVLRRSNVDGKEHAQPVKRNRSSQP